MSKVEVNLTNVDSWESFHAEFKEVMGFPDFYGRNMHAWEDCMSDLSKPGLVGMTKVIVPKGEDLELVLVGFTECRLRQPDIINALLDSSATINREKMKFSGASKLVLMPL